MASRGCSDRAPSLGSVKSRNAFLTVLEPGKAKVEAPQGAGRVCCWRAPSPGLRPAAFLLRAHAALLSVLLDREHVPLPVKVL